uniref:Uncharacterized protein n=1 Tax=Rhizophora mucronata TaxID=61149 RepID=A0A2P2JM88_RHIMU
MCGYAAPAQAPESTEAEMGRLAYLQV